MNDILDAREKRSKHIEELIKNNDYKTIVVLKANVPGIDKNISKMRFICNFFNKLLFDSFSDKIEESKRIESLDGNYIYYVINEEGNIVKEKTILIEDENRLGRLIDIDVYNTRAITREDVSCEMRTCLVCDNYAHICARSKAHTEAEIFEKIDYIIDEFLTEFLTIKTIKCIYAELDLFPKFGLVSRIDSGAHSDMDYQTFVQSTLSLKPYIKSFIEYGLQDIDNPLKLQEIGLNAEKAMFEATNNVNTQKGLIFLLGLFLPVITRAILHNKDVHYMKKEIRRISETVIGEYYQKITPSTHGDKIFLNYGLKGVRGEALNGLNVLFESPSFSNDTDEARQMNYLMYFMSVLDDTTILHHLHIETLHQVQKDMKEILKNGGFEKNKDLVHMVSESYKNQGISPGGSADMFVLKMMYEELKYLLCENNKNGICL